MKHTATITHDPIGGWWVEVHCPFDKRDRDRPCWPCEEDGSKSDAPPNDMEWGCTWQEWVVEGDGVLAEWSVTVPITVDWSQYDAPVFTLGEPTP